jgi:hypothetical protein
MPRRAPDVEELRSALARELATVSPRPGGWERVRDSLARPRAGRRLRLAWLLLAAPLVAAALLAGAVATAGAPSTSSLSARAVEAPPIVAGCAALAAIATPISLAESRRTIVRRACAARSRPA